MRSIILVTAVLFISFSGNSQNYRLIGSTAWDTLQQTGEYAMVDSVRAYFSGGNPGSFEDFNLEFNGYSTYNFYYNLRYIEIQFKADSILHMNYDYDGTGTVDEYERVVHVFNPFGDVVLRREERFYPDYNRDFKHDFIFDNCGGEINSIQQILKSNVYDTDLQSDITCEWSNGQLISARLLEYIEPLSGDPYISDHVVEYLYLENGAISAITVKYDISDDNYRVLSSTNYTYNADGTIATIVTEDESWDDEDTRIEFSYDAEGKLISKLMYNNYFNSFPDPWRLYTYTYDAEGNRIEELLERYVPEYESYVFELKHVYTFDANQLCQTETVYFAEDNIFHFGGETRYYYEEYDASDTLNAIDVAEDLLEIYPNPANCCAAVIYNVSEAGPVEIQMFNISGQLVYKDMIDATAGKNYFVLSLDELKLRSATYVITIFENGKLHTKQFVKY